MKKSGLLGYSILAVATLAIAACASTRWTVSCNGHGGSSGGVHEAECAATAEKSSLIGTLDFSSFDAARVWIDLSESNILAKPLLTVSVNLVLRRQGNIVASANFPATQAGPAVHFNDSGAVTNWLRAYSGLVDQVSGSIDGLGFTGKAGTNVVTMQLVYDGSVDSGASRSWYQNNGGGGCEGCALE